MNAAKAISESAASSARLPRGCLIAFGSIFLVAGCVALFFSLLLPAWNTWRAANWPASQATILSSQVIESHDDDGTSYRPEIRFRYHVNDVPFESDRWSFTVWSSTESWANGVVARYPAGSTHDCYFDPQSPANAVLDRSWSWTNLFGLFTLLFIAVGAGIIWLGVANWQTGKAGGKPAAVRERPANAVSGHHTRQAAAPLLMDSEEAPWEGQDGPRRLKPESSRMAQFVGISIFALIWNAICWTILVFVVRDDGLLSFAALFLSLFVLVGATLIVAAIYQFLALFNPVVSVALENVVVAAGDAVELAWETEGNAARIAELVIAIVAVEKATYTRGTDTTTDTHEYLRLTVAKTADVNEIRFGSQTVTIPADAMHSFQASRNRIEWSIDVRGVVRRWPDVRATFPFFVKPAGQHRETA